MHTETKTSKCETECLSCILYSSQVYKTACKSYQERLFTDLKNLVAKHCRNLKVQLDESVRH